VNALSRMWTCARMRVPGGGAIVPFSWAYRRLPFIVKGDLSVGGDL